MIRDYSESERAYHHTAPISMNYALHEALRIIEEVELNNIIKRHQTLGNALHKGLEAMGFHLHVDEKYRLPQLTSVQVPESVNEANVPKQLLGNYSIEVGSLKGKIWRIGLMDYSCNTRNITTVLGALEETLRSEGANVTKSEAIAAATEAMYSKVK